MLEDILTYVVTTVVIGAFLLVGSVAVSAALYPDVGRWLWSPQLLTLISLVPIGLGVAVHDKRTRR